MKKRWKSIYFIIDGKYVYSISNLNKIMLLFYDHKYKYFDLNSVFGFMVIQTANTKQ